MANTSQECLPVSTVYEVINRDLDLYARQRFQVLAVALIFSGLIINVVVDLRSSGASFAISAIGLMVTFLCYSWDRATTKWWGELINVAKEIEEKHLGFMGPYRRYESRITNPERSKFFRFLRPTYAVLFIYLILGFLWLGLAITSVAYPQALWPDAQSAGSGPSKMLEDTSKNVLSPD